MLTFKTSGFDQAPRRLRAAAKVLEDEKLAREALHESCEPIAERARVNIARSKGAGPHTGDQISVQDAPSELGVARVHVGVRGGKGGRAFIGGFLERGTSKMAAQPWLRPAYDAEKGSIAARFAAFLRERLAKAWAA